MTTTQTASPFTKNSKNAEIIEQFPHLAEQPFAFIYAKGEQNGDYQTYYVAQMVPRKSAMSKLKIQSLGWSEHTMKRGFITVKPEVIEKNPVLKAIYGSMLTPIENVSLKVVETIKKPYETASPRIKPAKSDDSEDEVLVKEGMPVYEIVDLDYGQYTELRYEGTEYVPRSVFGSDFTVIVPVK